MKKSLLPLLTFLFSGCILSAQSAQQAPAFSKGTVKTATKSAIVNPGTTAQSAVSANKVVTTQAPVNNNVLPRNQVVGTPRYSGSRFGG